VARIMRRHAHMWHKSHSETPCAAARTALSLPFSARPFQMGPAEIPFDCRLKARCQRCIAYSHSSRCLASASFVCGFIDTDCIAVCVALWWAIIVKVCMLDRSTHSTVLNAANGHT
jgi:hypothetical protein